ncbi:hypothetical protein D3C72_267760 [compost metagenome]
MLIQPKQLDLSKDLTFTGGHLRMGSGKIFLPTGSEALPAITFTDDNASGFLLSEPGEVAISAGGSIGFYLKSDGSIELPGTTGIAVQAGTTVERPSSPLQGILRYNLTTTRLETYIGTTWELLALQSQVQPLDSDLTALAGLTATGIIVRTGNGTATIRSLSATAGQTTVSDGDGVSGNPTVGLATTGVAAASYTRVTVDTYGRVTGGVLSARSILASQLENPSTAGNWPVTNLAPAYLDPNHTSLTVRGFDDARSEGVGFTETVPSNAANLKLSLIGHARTAPGASVAAVFQIYVKRYPLGTAPSAWSSAINLTNVSVASGVSTFAQTDTTISLATLGLSIGDLFQIEVVRVGANGSDTLTGDYLVSAIKLEWL